MDQPRWRSGKENPSSSSHVEIEQIVKKKKLNNDNEPVELHLLELPALILYEILSRLPVKTLFHCRSVCKLFAELLTDPYFAEVHLTKAPKATASIIAPEYLPGLRHPPLCMLDFDDTFLPRATTSSSINARSSTSGLYHAHSRSLRPSLIRRRVHVITLRVGEVTPVGSCNGLLCFMHTSIKESLYIICNPILGEYTVLPRPTPSTPAYTYLHHSGFGFCPESKQYKVIRYMFKTSSLNPVAEIYTVGTRSWRSIGDAPFLKDDGSFDHYLNGALHWITDHHVSSDPIYSLDLHTEQFHVVPPPSHFEQGYISKISGTRIGSLRGSLCLTYVSEDFEFTVWVMKEYGAKESWSKHFSIQINFFGGLRREDFHNPVKFSHNGDLWLLSKFNALVSYCHEKRSFKDLCSIWSVEKPELIAYVPSFVSLRNAVAGRNLKVQMSNKNAGIWIVI